MWPVASVVDADGESVWALACPVDGGSDRCAASESECAGVVRSSVDAADVCGECPGDRSVECFRIEACCVWLAGMLMCGCGAWLGLVMLCVDVLLGCLAWR